MNLFTHIISTEYSGRESYGKIKDYVSIVAEQSKITGEEPALILADKFSTAGQIPFYKECVKQGVKPVFGLRVTVQDDTEGDYDLILVAKDEAGRQNLNRIVSIAYEETVEKNYSRILSKDLLENNGGLICISPADNGLVEKLILQDRFDDAQKKAVQINRVFNGGFYLSVTRNAANDYDKEIQEKVINGVLKISEATGIDYIANNNTKFPRKDDYELHLARKDILDGVLAYDPSKHITETPNQYLIPTSQMLDIYQDIPESVFNSSKLVSETDQTDFKNRLGVSRLPEFPIPEGFDDSPIKYLKHISAEGFENRWAESIKQHYLEEAESQGITDVVSFLETKKKEYYDRVDFELEVIEKTGFAGYFLIVQDLTNWCKAQEIPVGPGRGSGAGSLVLYSLNITNVNPVPYNLLFERFLNPERLSEPDIDIDFSPKNRERVITYMKDLYGEENTAQILTEGTMASKSSIDYVGRISGLKPHERDKIKDLLSETLGTTIKDEMEFNEGLISAYQESRQVKYIIDKAMELEGSIVSYGKHAGGVVISLGDMQQYAAVYKEKGEAHSPVVQIPKDFCEDIGLIKFDILGLRNLDVISECLKYVNEGRSPADFLNADDIRMDDKEAIKLFQTADTFGIFQFGEGGMRRIMKELRPDNFEEVVALVALFRPGPLQSKMHEDFIERKFDPSKLKYIHPDLVDVLEPTKGTIIYQEQVMSIGRKLAGYSLGKADLLRRAMGSKNMQVMAEQNLVFIDGCLENYRDKTLENTGSKLPNPNDKTKFLPVDVVMSDTKLQNLKELTSDTGGKLAKSDQLYEVLKMYAGFNENELNAFKDDYKEMEEAVFYKSINSRFMKNGVEKSIEEGLSREDAREEMAKLSVRSAMFIRFNKIFNVMEKFASYGFNKSHSVAYAKISMQTAYLKSHYPAQYMAAILSNEPNIEKVSLTLSEVKRMGLKIKKPDINESVLDFVALSNNGNEKEIRYGLAQIKGINASVEHIVKLRDEKGKVKDIYDFYDKFGSHKIESSVEQLDGTFKNSSKTLITKAVLNNLINSGALDSLCPNGNPAYRPNLQATYTTIELAEKEVKKVLKANSSEINKKLKAVLGDSTTEVTKKLREMTGSDKVAGFLNPTDLAELNVDDLKRVYLEVEKFISENQPPKKKVTFNIKELNTMNEEVAKIAGEGNTETVDGIVYVTPNSTNLAVVPKYGSVETASMEKNLTGSFLTLNPIDLNGIRARIHKKGLTITPSQDVTTSVELSGEVKGQGGRKYLPLSVAGTVVEVNDFQKFDNKTSEPYIEILVKIDDGQQLIDVKFKDNRVFSSGKERRGIDQLKSMINKDVLIVEGSAMNQNYESGAIVVYANNIGSTNEDIYLPSEKPHLNFVKGDKIAVNTSYKPKPQAQAPKTTEPATAPQMKVVQAMVNNGAIKLERILEESNVKSLDDLTKSDASKYISEIKEIQMKRNASKNKM